MSALSHASLMTLRVIRCSPRQLNAFALLGSLCGGLGTFTCLCAQSRWRFTIKQGVVYGSIMLVMP